MSSLQLRLIIIVGKVMLVAVPFRWMRTETLAKHQVKRGRSMGRQAQINATAGSAVLQMMKGIPPSVEQRKGRVISTWNGVQRCYSRNRGLLTAIARATLVQTPLVYRKSYEEHLSDQQNGI